MNEDFDEELRRILAKPPTAEQLAMASKAVENMQRQREWYAQASEEERAAYDQQVIEAGVDFILHGPGGD